VGPRHVGSVVQIAGSLWIVAAPERTFEGY